MTEYEYLPLVDGHVYRLGDMLLEAARRKLEDPDGDYERWFLLELSESGEYVSKSGDAINPRFVEAPQGMWWDVPTASLTDLDLEFVAEDREELKGIIDDDFRTIMADMDW